MEMNNLRSRDKKPSVETTTAQVVELPEKQGDGTSLIASEKWKPGFWIRFPWIGAGSLLSVVVLTALAIVVLLLSNGKAYGTQWPRKAPVPTILTGLNSVAAVCVTVAVAQGVAISWWRKAMHGASIKQLHDTWSFGSSILSILFNFKYFNLAALAALVTKLTIVDGILFQRASSTYSALGPAESRQIATFPATNIPFTGRLNEFGNDTDFLLWDFTWDLQTWTESGNGLIASTFGYGNCDGICTLRSSQPGYMVKCDNPVETVIDIIGDATANAIPNTTRVDSQFTMSSVSFNITFATAAKNYTWIGLNTTSYSPLSRDTTNATQRCPATITTRSCELREAMLSYPMYLQKTEVATTSKDKKTSYVNVYLGTANDSTGEYVSFDDFDYEFGQIPDFTFEQYINSSGSSKPLSYVANGGIARALSDQYGSRTWITTHSNDSRWSVGNSGQYSNLLSEVTYNVTNNYSCPSTFVDPIYGIISGLNTLTLITTDDIQNRPAWSSNMTTNAYSAYYNASRQYVTGRQWKTEIHYQTNKRYMYGAIASTLVCLLLILPVYWGFWELGRKVTLNPIEIANAFQAPLFTTAMPKSGFADDVVEVAGNQLVTYARDQDPEAGVRYKIMPR